MEINFTPIKANQIEIKPTDTKTEGKCTLLLYIDSRSAGDIINEAVGALNWQIKYKDVGGVVFGSLSIWDNEKNMWIEKEDCGDVSDNSIGGNKSLASDILKRCLARWGYDWLYHTPRIKINCPPDYYFNGKMTMAFSVKSIAFDQDTKECVELVIVDRFGKEVYNLNSNQQIQNKAENKVIQPSKSNMDMLIDFCKKESEITENKEQLTRFYNYYKDKANNWKNAFNVEQLWLNWNKPKAA